MVRRGLKNQPQPSADLRQPFARSRAVTLEKVEAAWARVDLPKTYGEVRKSKLAVAFSKVEAAETSLVH
jgi:hypothetical protein